MEQIVNSVVTPSSATGNDSRALRIQVGSDEKVLSSAELDRLSGELLSPKRQRLLDRIQEQRLDRLLDEAIAQQNQLLGPEEVTKPKPINVDSPDTTKVIDTKITASNKSDKLKTEENGNSFVRESAIEFEVKKKIFEDKGGNAVIDGALIDTRDKKTGEGFFVGLQRNAQAIGEISAKANKDGISANIKLVGNAEALFASTEQKISAGSKDSFPGEVSSTFKARASSVAGAKAEGNVTISRQEVSTGVALGAEVVALKLQASAESETSTFFGILSFKPKVQGDLNLGGIGGQAEIGLSATLSRKPEVKFKIGAGVTALVGGRLKFSGAASVDLDRFDQVRNDFVTNITSYGSLASDVVGNFFR